MATLDDINDSNSGSRRRRAKMNRSDGSQSVSGNTREQLETMSSDSEQATEPETTISSNNVVSEPTLAGDSAIAGGVLTEEETHKSDTTPKSMEELVNILYPQQSQEDIEAENKRERRRQMWAAIGDGISSLANLYFTTKGAPSLTDTSGLSKSAQQKWEQLVKDREENTAMRRKAQMDAIKSDREDLYRRNKDEREETKSEYMKAIAEAKDKRDADLDDLRMLLLGHKITKEEYNAKVAEVKAKYAETKQEADIARLNRTGTGKEPLVVEGKRFSNNTAAQEYVYRRADELGISKYVEDQYGKKIKRNWLDIVGEINRQYNNNSTPSTTTNSGKKQSLYE